MSLEVELPRSKAAGASARAAAASRGSGTVAERPEIVVALVNNMPDTAVEGTENQFNSLLAAAAGTTHIRLRYASPAEITRGPAIAARMAERYWQLEELYAEPPDALIVTGTEPRAASLSDEPYWPRLVELIDFARSRLSASVWSCLAAHAAVLHLDGIGRDRLSEKRCGVYDHTVLAGHPLTAGLSSPLSTPQSRWNDLPVADLEAAGYEILSRSPETGADTFAKSGKNLMLFFQGHPEYEERTLLKEYRRDVGRFICGQQDRYPKLPAGYFGPEARALLIDFEQKLIAGKLKEPLAAFPFSAVAALLVNTWSESATRFYANWLAYVVACKQNSTAAAPRAL